MRLRFDIHIYKDRDRAILRERLQFGPVKSFKSVGGAVLHTDELLQKRNPTDRFATGQSEKGRASPADLFIAQEESKTFSGAGNLLIILGILSELES